MRPDGREARQLPAGDWGDFYRQVAGAIRDGLPPPVDAGEARDVVAVIERAYAAADQLR